MLMDELVNNVGKHKSLVFSQFSSMLDLLAEECKRRELAFFHFDGQTPAAQRAKMVEAFQSEEDNTPVFLISLKAGNAGLNLTSADYVFLFDPWWNTAVQQQAINRTHRIGQQKSVFAYQLICKDTIEEKIIAIQQRKQKLSEELITTEENFLQTLSEEELMDLFS
jgi:SNF2 family DNA or RNA helicase